MDTTARKYQLIEYVMQLSEADLTAFEELLSANSLLSQKLEKSLDQVKNGDFRSHEEVRKKYEKWL